MQEREQKWYSGMLGVTFNANEGRITIFRSMLEALGWPTYYRFLYNRKMGQIAVQACKAEDAGAHRVTRLNETNSCEIKCVAFSRMIYQDAYWNMKRSYRLDGKLFPEQNLVSFPILDAIPIENGKILEAAVSPTVAPRQAEASPSQNNPSSAPTEGLSDGRVGKAGKEQGIKLPAWLESSRLRKRSQQEGKRRGRRISDFSHLSQ